MVFSQIRQATLDYFKIDRKVLKIVTRDIAMTGDIGDPPSRAPHVHAYTDQLLLFSDKKCCG